SSARTVMGSTTSSASWPLGPFTVTVAPSIVTSTPEGMVIGSRPIRDISTFSFRTFLGSPDVGEDFPAHTLLGGLTVGEQAGGRGDDRHAQAAQHAGQVGGL